MCTERLRKQEGWTALQCSKRAHHPPKADPLQPQVCLAPVRLERCSQVSNDLAAYKDMWLPASPTEHVQLTVHVECSG